MKNDKETKESNDSKIYIPVNLYREAKERGINIRDFCEEKLKEELQHKKNPGLKHRFVMAEDFLLESTIGEVLTIINAVLRKLNSSRIENTEDQPLFEYSHDELSRAIKQAKTEERKLRGEK